MIAAISLSIRIKMNNNQAKKRMMFLTGEDFYYFTYSIILTLELLGCKNGKYFKDYRKLPFIVEFINDDNLMYIFESHVQCDNAIRLPDDDQSSPSPQRAINKLDKEYMFRSYSTGMARRSEFLKLLFTLEKSGFVVLEKGDLNSAVNVSLARDNVPATFFDTTLFSKECKNTIKLQSMVKRLASLNLSTMLTKIYESQGVKTWAL